MFGIENYGVFVISGILLNITSGADTAYILSRSITGKKPPVRFQWWESPDRSDAEIGFR